MAPKRKGGNGRKKITIRRIEKKGARQVCFAKRRQGMFNKANELAVMCGAKVTAVAYSPGGKAFSFRHPSAEAIIDRFVVGGGRRVLSATDNNKLKKMHLQHEELHTQLKEVKMRKEYMEEAMAKERAVGDQIAVWLNPELGDIGKDEMMAFAAKLMQAGVAVSEGANQVLLNLGMENVLRELRAHGVPLSGFSAGMEMQQMVSVMSPQPDFANGTGKQQVTIAMPPPEFPTDKEMPPPMGIAARTEMVQQGLRTNMGFPY